MSSNSSGFSWLPDYQNIMACATQEPLLPELLQQEEEHYWKELQYLLTQMPKSIREIWEVCDALLDEYEYKDSCLYVEYIDAQAMNRIADKIYEKVKYQEEQKKSNEEQAQTTTLALLVRVILCWNTAGRRERYWRRKKVFEC